MLKSNYYTEPTEIDKLVFGKLIPEDHYLRKAKVGIDFACFRDEVRDCYSPDMGRGAEDPVRMIKLEILQFQYRLSDREVIAQAQVNVAFRFFLDLSLESALPVPSLLSQFRSRLGEGRHRQLFDNIVSQARAKGLVKDRLRIKDATHIIANIAIPSTIALVAKTRDRLLDSVRPYASRQVEAEVEKARQIREATADLKNEERLMQRVAHLREIVVWADGLQQLLIPISEASDPNLVRFDEALAVTHKVLADRENPDGEDRLLSVVDSDARTGQHQGFFDGYLLDISMDADSELITALNVLPGNGDEAGDAEVLIQAEEQAHQNDIEQLSIDGIGWRGKVLRTLSDPEGLNVDVYVPPRDRPSDGDRFTPDDFTLNEAGTTLTCPAGQQTSARYRNTSDTGWKFEFTRTRCANCELRNLCVPQLPQKKGRSVIKNEYQADYDAAREKATTERYARVRKLHPRVERKLSDVMNNHGGRRARYRGWGKVKIQSLLAAMASNIKRIIKLIDVTEDTCVRQPI
jgi:transposase